MRRACPAYGRGGTCTHILHAPVLKCRCGGQRSHEPLAFTLPWISGDVLPQAMIKGDKQAAGSSVLEVGGTQLAVPDF